MDNNQLVERTAQLIAHRVVHAAEHGKIHGYCIVCGVPWPCVYAGQVPTTCKCARCSWLETVVRHVVLNCTKDCTGELIVNHDNGVTTLYCTCDKDYKYTTNLMHHALTPQS